MTFFGITLVIFFKLHLLSFVSNIYFILPIVYICLGSLTLINSFYGIFAVLSQRTTQININAVCHGLLGNYRLILHYRQYTEIQNIFIIITVIGSLYSIIITFELRSSISAQDIYAQSQKFSAIYGHSSGSKALDNLQQYYMCCGGNSNFKAIPNDFGHIFIFFNQFFSFDFLFLFSKEIVLSCGKFIY